METKYKKYQPIINMDFSSLYPTTMGSYNNESYKSWLKRRDRKKKIEQIKKRINNEYIR